MKKTLFSKLLKTYVLITLLSITVAILFFYLFFKSYYFNEKEHQLITQGEKMAGLLSPHLKNSQLKESIQIIDHYNLVNTSRMWIVNKDGKLISELEDQSITNHLQPKTDQLERALNGEIITSHGFVKYIDDPVLSVAVPILAGREVIGVIFVCNPLSDITASVIEALKIVIFAGITSLIIVAFVSYFISQSITRPINEITKASLEMMKGNFTHQPKVHSADEIGKLALTFNNMRQTLDKTLQDLENEKNKMVAMERMQREFVANASHELRTPLTSVRGYLEGMLDGVINSKEQDHKYLRIILKETIRLHRLVNSLLDLSRIESGQIKVNKREIPLPEVINLSVEKLMPLAQDQFINLETDLPSQLPNVIGDEDLIEQVLINYITNAIRFTPEDGTITVKAVPHENEVHVHVSDTGVGIYPEELKHIWKRFYKVDKDRPLSKEGAGLGLSLVQEIMNRLEGKAWAKSTVNEGSTFSFSLKSA
ncbi:sensor histidine kinase [Schinkia azotoformans]|uniref:sensor histidine kinase n=1 Tax=Schinkia azotoformans TaxID=1454 RepID=UPI002DB76C54|nr:ATP-binding protein [Schinkia azotoformans]MEC1721982.1 ATP-binding protein [Schinkia azotoformans]MED4415313.1 ATP-binding protein [Schinkia azotoformans]